METNVTKEQIQAARKVDLHRFLLHHHPNEVLQEGAKASGSAVTTAYRSKRDTVATQTLPRTRRAIPSTA